MARGAVISFGCVIGMLPMFLMIFDGLIMKTTIKPKLPHIDNVGMAPEHE